MALKKEIVEFLEVLNNVTAPALVAKGFKLTIINAREGHAALCRNMLKDIIALPQICDDIVSAKDYFVPVRIYNPNPDVELPVLMAFHGGGFNVGSVLVYEPIYRKLAARTNHIVVAVEYRLAPECPYPAGLVDCYNATKNIWPVLEARKIKHKRELSMTGDSAGGCICAYIASKAQHDLSMKIKSQILWYPGVDFTMQTKSMKELGQGHFLTQDKMHFFYDNLFQHNEDRYVESVLNQQFTQNIPPTLVITAGYDPLKDEGIAYAEKTKAAGVLTKYVCLENMIHAFMNMEALANEECEQVYALTKDFLLRV